MNEKHTVDSSIFELESLDLDDPQAAEDLNKALYYLSKVSEGLGSHHG